MRVVGVSPRVATGRLPLQPPEELERRACPTSSALPPVATTSSGCTIAVLKHGCAAVRTADQVRSTHSAAHVLAPTPAQCATPERPGGTAALTATPACVRTAKRRDAGRQQRAAQWPWRVVFIPNRRKADALCNRPIQRAAVAPPKTVSLVFGLRVGFLRRARAGPLRAKRLSAALARTATLKNNCWGTAARKSRRRGMWRR